MNWIGISPEQGPKISVPFRFYLLAHINILFLIFLMIFKFDLQSLDLTQHKTLILFHAFSIGFLLFIIVGSIFQMLPVVVGVIIQHSELLSIALIFLFYVIFFMFYQYFTYFNHLGFFVLLLSLMILMLIFYFIAPLIKKTTQDNIGFLLSLISLLIGLILILFYFINLSLNLIDLDLLYIRRLHAIIMFVGFIQQLIVTVSFQVIPMFYVSEPYPKYIKYLLNYGYIALILLIIFFLHRILLIMYLILNLIYIFFTSKVILKRTRKILDTTILFFGLGILLLFLFSFALIFEDFTKNHLNKLILIFVSFILSFIYGMLYKIIPFLCWFHLQSTKNRILFDSLSTNKNHRIFSLYFYMADFSKKNLEYLQLFLFIVMILFLFFDILTKFHLFLLLIYFINSLYLILYALYKYKKILNAIKIL